MVKILRKNSKWLMAIGGSLLMLTFLISGSNNPFAPDPDKMAVAEMMGKPVQRKEAGKFSIEFDALKEFVPGVVRLQLGVENGTHWMLLVREAESAGLVGEARDGADWLPELAQSEAVAEVVSQYGSFAQQLIQNRNFMQQQVDRIQTQLSQALPIVAARNRMTTEEFEHALSRLRGVSRLINAYDGAARMSDRRLVLDARERLDGVIAKAVIIPADRLVSEIAEPTEEQLKAHFEKYQKVKPQDGEYGIGYVLPERVKLEWFEADAGEIAKIVKPDPIAVSKEYQLNRDKYPGEFAAEKGKIEQALIKSKTDEVMAEIDRVYKARVRAATRSLEADGPIRKLPADWESQRPTMESLANDVRQAVEESEGLKLPTFRVVRLADRWVRLDEVSNMPGIGRGTVRLGSNSSSLEQVLASDADFDPKAPLGLQTLVPLDTPVESGQNRFYFCVLATKGEAPAESLDEVRDRAIADFKRIAAFEKLKGEVEQFKSTAVSEGLEAVAKMFEKPASGTTPPIPALQVLDDLRISRTSVGKEFSRPDATTQTLDVPEVRDEVMKQADALGPKAEATPENAAARTSVVPVPKSLCVAVIQQTQPVFMAKEDVRLLSHDVVTSLLRSEQREVVPQPTNPFSFDAMKERLGYKSKSEDKKS
ncbi:MAG: hypothetical protein GC200_04200 [Tepidisphaera sp.]|nr:hypothetical protein [Tepidisphaera sp.]